MMDPVPVPAKTLRQLRRLAREGRSPMIYWSESRQKMDQAAHDIARERLATIEEELSELLPDETP